MQIPNNTYNYLRQVLDYQNKLVNEVNDTYVDGFHDGVEIVMAAIEQRDPVLTELKLGLDQVLM